MSTDSDISRSFYNSYDSQFTADISKQMQMPDRLIAHNGGQFDSSNESYTNNFNSHDNRKFHLQLNSMQFPEPHYILETPPRSIRTDFPGTTLADDDNDYEMMMSKKWPSQNKKFNVKNNTENESPESEKDVSVPMTPGTLLLLQNGDNLSALQRQLNKLSHRVSQLQEENRRRNNRELILYPLVLGYILIQIGKFIMKSK